MTEYWFKQKQRGYGAGMPIHWKGWALLGVFIAAILAVPAAMTMAMGNEGTVLFRLAIVAALSVPFLWIARAKTEGGWRWRNGREET